MYIYNILYVCVCVFIYCIQCRLVSIRFHLRNHRRETNSHQAPLTQYLRNPDVDIYALSTIY